MKKTKKTLLTIAGLLVALISIFPLFWMALAGFKPKTEVLGYPFKFFPTVWDFSNYNELLHSTEFIRSMGVTFVGAIIFTVLVIFVNSMAAYSFARLNFPYKNTLFIYVIMTMFIPSMAILIPSYIVVAKLKMLNTLTVLILPGVASAVNMFLMRQFYLGIPKELEEAAVIDGATKFGIYRHIFLPLSVPVFVLVGIGSFLGFWNSLIWPIMTISDERLYQIMQTLAYFRSAQATEWAMIMAGSTMAAIPTIILFAVFQKYLIEGIKLSGIK
ncbi:carbohydrate ABC transporter permease [Robertmurraya yapensis]|uniref:Carbohydrate ABC transporter permease n=2 Tax=Bacillaceae TaxID=186817 RepID=A0A3S0LI82_9BACI|nr:carbohydrate ABC transporter permease [Bacillus yapensis]RTR36104.1 carbohydrate ABC transporter permease [Bacillus yapensis]TKT05607.1 ABC transporter permease subunit [Bacillus yapensis]